MHENGDNTVFIPWGPSDSSIDIKAPKESNIGLASQPHDLDLPPVDTGFDAWLYCFSACALDTLVWGWNNTYGVFQDYYTSKGSFDNASPIAVSAIGTTARAIQYMELIIVISICQRYPEFARTARWSALVVCVLALIASSFATQIWHLILFQGIIYGLSAGVLYAPLIVFLPQWFVAKRGLAGGIIFGGSGVGGFIFPLALGAGLDRFGFRWALRGSALIFGVCCSLALIGSKPRIPVRPHSAGKPRPSWPTSILETLKNPILLGVLGTTVVQALSFFPVSFFIAPYTTTLTAATSATSSTIISTVTLAMFNAASVVCFILFGWICDSYPYPLVMLFSGVGSALAAFLLWGFARNTGLVFAFALVFGGLSGGFPGVWTKAATDIAGVGANDELTSLAIGAITFVKGAAAIVGPMIAAALHENGLGLEKYGSFGYRKVEIFVGSMAVATAVGAVLLMFVSNTRRKWRS